MLTDTPYYFHPARVAEGRHIMTQWLRDVKSLLVAKIAVGETATLLHPPLPLIGVSMGCRMVGSIMTVSPTARPRPPPTAVRESCVVGSRTYRSAPPRY